MSELVTVFGGSGFVGKYVVRALCKAGKRVRVAMRRPHLGHELRVMGDVGQVSLVQANVRNVESVARAVEGADAVVNLVGLLYEKGKQKFETTMSEGAKNIAEAAKAQGIKRFVQISAIGADTNGKSKYAQAKGQAEEAVSSIIKTATILRPSVIFGVEDGFFNKFAAIERFSPIMPLIGGGQTKFQPVYVGDVARAALAAIDNENAQGKVFELGGPNQFTFEQILRYISKETARPRAFLKIPFGLMQFLGNINDFIFRLNPFSGPPFTGDQIELMRIDNVVSEKAKGFKDLGITDLINIEAIVPSYLYRFRPHGQFEVMAKAKS